MTARGATRKRSQRRTPRRRRDYGRLLRYAGAGLAGSSALALAALAGWYLKSLPVERVMVTGELSHVDRGLLQETINESLSGGFLWLDLQALRAPLEELPWVDRVVVRRQWPDSIEVRVIEQRAIARWGDAALLNHTGEVFAPSADAGNSELPLLSGPDGSHGLLMRHYRLVQERLQRVGLRVRALHMDARGGLTATLEDGGELVFGRDRIEEKLERLQLLYPRRLVARRADLARVDLRYSHGAAVTWTGAAAAAGKDRAAAREDT